MSEPSTPASPAPAPVPAPAPAAAKPAARPTVAAKPGDVVAAPAPRAGGGTLALRLARVRGEVTARDPADNQAIIGRDDTEAGFDASGLSEEQKDALAELLADINGSDAYSELSNAQAEVSRAHRMVIPDLPDADIPIVAPADVGTAATKLRYSLALAAQVYALNKARAPEAAYDVKFAAIRTAAFTAGYFSGQAEVIRVPAVPNAVRIYLADMGANPAIFREANELGYLVPLFTEFVFRQRGHHFITAQIAEYTKVYTKLAEASMSIVPHSWMPAHLIYHACLHWTGPARNRQILLAKMGGDSIPDALKIRAYAAPAGSAIISTSASILEMLPTATMRTALFESLDLNEREFDAVVEAIKAAPDRYHKAYFAYEVPAPDRAASDAFDRAHAAGVTMAPVLQGFVNATLRNADMGRAMALKKHADANPVMQKKAEAFFKAYARQKVARFADIFSGDIAKPAAAAAEEEEV